MTEWNFRQTQDAVHKANQWSSATIVVRMRRGWNPRLAEAAIDMAKKLYGGRRQVVLKAGSRKTVVSANDSAVKIRKSLAL
jgi:hypothetical protein